MNETRVFVYSRVSTNKQELLQQERTTHEWLVNHHLTADVVVSDEGVSGKVSYKDRKLGKELLPQMKRGDILVVSEVSRLGRSMANISKLVNEELKERGIRLIIVAMGLDLDCSRMSSVDELILANFSFAAQLERELISERVTSSLKAKKLQGVKFGKANENYTIREDIQKLGNEKKARTRNYQKLVSKEFQAFCRILKRVYPKLQEHISDEPLFMLRWKQTYVDFSRAKADECLEQMNDLHLDNNELFAKWDFTIQGSKRYSKFFSHLQSVFKSIDKYNELNER